VLYGHHLITTGLRDAARYLARLDDPMASQTQGKQLAVYGQIGGSTHRVSWWNVGNVSVTLQPTANPPNPTRGVRAYRGGDPINVVRVSTTVTYPGLGLLGFLGLSAPTINLYHEERVITE